MPSRRFHHKSRHGCTNCKQRKIRCAEERPSCANCVRLGGRCSFLDSDPRGGPLVHSSPESSSSTPQTSAASTHSSGDRPEAIEQYDEELITRWSEATCFTLTDRFEIFPMWQLTVPGIALDQPFLRHGLLALSSMHLRYTSSLPWQKKYLDLASQHQAAALARYIPELQVVTPQNCHALFAFSAVLLPIQYAFISVMDGDIDGEEVLSDITSVSDYIIGATVIAHQGRDWLRQGCLQQLMTRRTVPENIIPALLNDPRDALSGLLAYVQRFALAPEADQETTEKVSIYMHSISMLTNAFPTENPDRRYFDDMIGWPHFVGANFVQLLKERDPMALVILAHYGVALNAFSHFWWLQGVGVRLIHAIGGALTADSLALIQWPLNTIAVDEESHQMFIM